MKPLFLAGLLPLLVPAQAGILFEDTFDRADSRNIQAVLDGITDATGSSLSAGSVYSLPFLDPNNAPPTFGVQDGDALNGGGARILGGSLQLAVGAGTSNAFVNHNFTNAEILAAGGFSVSLDVLGYAQATNGQGGGFAVGMTHAEAVSAGDAFSGTARMTGSFGTAIGTPVPAANVSDFWVVLRGNNTLVWGGKSGNVLGATGLTSKLGTVVANFRFDDFNAGSTVDYEVLLGDLRIGTGAFMWSDTDSNYIGIDVRDSTAVTLDRFRVTTDFAEPLPYPPYADAFEATRLTGTNDTRIRWRVTEGTAGDPVTITIRQGETTVHTASTLTGFADVDGSGGETFTLTASNSAGDSDPLEATVADDDAFAAAVRADAPAAWYRFNESFASRLIVDSAENVAPHDGSAIGSATTGSSGPRDGTASFSGSGASILADLIFDAGALPDGHTVEAIVRRLPGGNPDAAIVSQTDGGGVGRSHLAVHDDGSVRTFLAGGPDQRKDADAKLPANTWAHLVMTVDKAVPEIRWYLDGEPAGTTADGTNPDGSTFEPNLILESAGGAWRIGTQKDAAQNFWLGDMDEVAVYDHVLSEGRVAAHAGAWLASASGLLGFSAASETVAPGGSTTLVVKAGSDATSVTIDSGIGPVTPVDGTASVPVSPAETTTYTVTVESQQGIQVLSVTVTVEVPPVPPAVASGSIVGGDFRITFTGEPFTLYRVRGSLDLLSFGIDHGTAATDGTGLGEATVPLVPGEGVHFYRLEESP